MQTATGKTISRIEERPTDPKYSYAQDDTLLLHFTDGTALKIRGSSYEEVSLSYDEIDRAEAVAHAHAAQGRREKERVSRLERDAWNALTDAERAEKNAARRAKMSPFALAIEDQMKAIVEDMRNGFGTVGFGSTITIPMAQPKKTKARRS